mmetsp:Transcript_17678/g.18325  ORF Transcript_17678/g.18325 Transcript_17678/m.18325 type:complete len:463 (+) Transcript_17678:3-1391(+)
MSKVYSNISNFSEEYKAIRFASFLISFNLQQRIEGYRNMISIAQKLRWTFYLDDLCIQLRNDKSCFLALESHIPTDVSSNLNKVASNLDAFDSYFSKLNTKDLQTESVKVKDYAKQYYELGCFSQYISVFNRFLVNIKNDFPEPELHQFIVRYVISCIIKRQFDLAISELTKLKHNFNLYDISIYIFYIKLVNGKFLLAEEEILGISNSIFPEVFEKIIDKDSLFFYIILIMLVCYKKQIIDNLQISTQCYGYKLIESSPERFSIIFNYGKCKFATICREFNTSILSQIGTDHILAHYADKINEDFKENIITQVVKSSESVPIKYLSDLISEKPELIERMVVSLIKNGNLNYRIDKVNKLIVALESTTSFQTYKRSLVFTEKTHFSTLNRLLNKCVVRGYSHPEISKDEMKVYEIIESGGAIGGLGKKISGGIGGMMDMISGGGRDINAEEEFEDDDFGRIN